jgi:hypothetical protein
MKAENIGEVSISIRHGVLPLMYIRANKFGLVERQGHGTVVGNNFRTSITENSALVFNKIMTCIPLDLLGSNQSVAEQNPNVDALEYVLTLHGGKLKADHFGEQEWEWSKSWNVGLTPDSSYMHPLLPVLEAVCTKAELTTSRMYFDSVICFAFGAKSDNLPAKVNFHGPKEYRLIKNLLTDYLDNLRMTDQYEALTAYGLTQNFRDASGMQYKLCPSGGQQDASLYVKPMHIPCSDTTEHLAVITDNMPEAKKKVFPFFKQFIRSRYALTSTRIATAILLLTGIVFFSLLN